MSHMHIYRSIKVWDKVVRLTHWVNVLSVLILLTLGGFMHFEKDLLLKEETVETITNYHAIVGFVFAFSLLLRLSYLFSDSRTGSWKDLIPYTRDQFKIMFETIIFYVKGFKGKVPLYFAHNPLASIFYIAFFIFAIMQVFSGILVYLGGEAEMGIALAHSGEKHIAEPLIIEGVVQPVVKEPWPPHWLHEMHEIGSVGIIFFIVAHLSALFIHDLLEKRGLASSMISGDKFFTDEECWELEIEKKEFE